MRVIDSRFFVQYALAEPGIPSEERAVHVTKKAGPARCKGAAAILREFGGRSFRYFPAFQANRTVLAE